MTNPILRNAILLSVFLAASSAALHAKDPVAAVNSDRKGVALKGYDPVAYFTQSKPVKGSPQHSHSWNGATWQFSSSQNRDLFAASPEKYAPQFGGYCAWAVGHGYTADVDPEAWSIVGGKLYVNYNKDVLSKWSRDTEKWIAEGVRNWPGLHK